MRTGEEQATLLDEDGHCKYTPRSGRLERARAPLALGAVLLVLWCCGAPPLVLFGSWLLGGRGVQPIIINHGQLTMQVLPVGAIIQKLYVPDKHGKLADIMLGFDEADVGRYTDGTSPYFGAVVGRVANRIANATFRLPGKYGEASHTLARNEGSFPGSLHGGRRGWDKVTWRVEERSSSSVKLTRRSVSGEEGYPGSVDASVTYTLTAENELIAEFAATADAATPINMAQHAYFNLGGHDGKGGSVLEHELTLPGAEHARRRLALATPPPNALPPLSTPPHPRLLPMHPCRNTPSPHQVLPVDAARIPTGEFRAVAGTPFDFTQSRRIGSQIDQAGAGRPRRTLSPPPGAIAAHRPPRLIDPARLRGCHSGGRPRMESGLRPLLRAAQAGCARTRRRRAAGRGVAVSRLLRGRRAAARGEAAPPAVGAHNGDLDDGAGAAGACPASRRLTACPCHRHPTTTTTLPGVHEQLPRRQHRGQGRCRVPQVRRGLSGDAGLPQRGQHARLPELRAGTARRVPPPHRLQVLGD